MINKIHNGDVLEVMARIPDASVDSVITSPPYWQLRNYGYPEQWGLEPTYQEYLEHLWALMDEIWRVLKDTGTVWINLGDTYGTKSGGMASGMSNAGIPAGQIEIKQPKNIHKCLLLIPHRFAIGCIDKEWIVRNDIIWAKRNAMPESVTDRFSKKHEYIFFMTKKPKYYFDLDSIREAHSTVSIERYKYDFTGHENGKNPGSISDFWDITTKGSSEKHYASFNFKLIEKPIIAGSPEGGIILDPFCGKGTTLVRALQLNRKVIGIDGSKEYCQIAERDINQEINQLKIF